MDPAPRTFDTDGQLDFALLSGDINPIHMDPIAARRTTFRAPLVHGVHALLWALDGLCATETGARAIESLRVSFRLPIRVGDRVRRTLAHDPAGGSTITVDLDGRPAVTVTAVLTVDSTSDVAIPTETESDSLSEPTFAEAAVSAGAVPLAIDLALCGRLFPSLEARLSHSQIAELLAATRLVGMRVPGRHSLFAEIDIHRRAATGGPAILSYRTARADARFGAVHLAIEGPTLVGTLKTFYRAPPVEQATALELAELVTPGEFSKERALVIGGSRGLGEVTAKLLAAGGADIVVTYAQGADDARRVCADVARAGGHCRPIAFDCLRPEDLVRALDDFAPTDLHYFATPSIVLGDDRTFSADRFARFCDFYVAGFAATVQAAHSVSGALRVLYPSTVFLDERPPGSGEYCAAKAAGEEVCAHLMRGLPHLRIHAPRLPRLATDQTTGLLGARPPKPELALLQALRARAPGDA